MLVVDLHSVSTNQLILAGIAYHRRGLTAMLKGLLLTSLLATAIPVLHFAPSRDFVHHTYPPQPGSGAPLHMVGVIGDENRFSIPSEFGYFADVGGLLTAKFGTSYSTCTGYLIGEEWVVTASHRVIDHANGKPADEVTFDLALFDANDFTYPREYGTEF